MRFVIVAVLVVTYERLVLEVRARVGDVVVEPVLTLEGPGRIFVTYAPVQLQDITEFPCVLVHVIQKQTTVLLLGYAILVSGSTCLFWLQ